MLEENTNVLIKATGVKGSIVAIAKKKGEFIYTVESDSRENGEFPLFFCKAEEMVVI